MCARDSRLETTADAMGTTWTIVLYGQDQPGMQAAAAAAFEELRRIESVLSIHQPSSDWSRINREASHSPVSVSPETLGLLERCLEYSRRSGGSFDVSVGPLVEAWGFSRGRGRQPSESEISGALARVGWRGIRLDPAACTVRFETPGMSLDPGGIGKGYAVDRLAERLRLSGFAVGLVAASGSTICCMGTPPGRVEGWPVEIRNPSGRRAASVEVALKDLAVSTSGVGERAFWDGRKVQGHLIDPGTGRPARGMLQASVIARLATDAEAWTKPCFIRGRAWAGAHLPPALEALFFEDDPSAGWSRHSDPASRSSIDWPGYVA